MMNADVFQDLDQLKDHLEELIQRTHPDEQSIPGATLHQRLKTIRQKIVKIETAMFLSFPRELKDDLLAARKTQRPSK